ncbi:DUF4870 family protein [Alkanindiges sp. WGS2144]|uniref:DUF4870 family protein n=1 Tax=Alkanindiges sp. WGS2144 TaxID=3366808 RepID=UPI00375093F0
MNTPEQQEYQSISNLEANRKLTLIIYVLYALAIFNGITAIIAVILNYIKQDEVQDTWLQSHFDWHIKTFWWTLLWGIVGTVTSFILIGFVILFVLMVWYIYRIAKGFLAFNEQRPV